MKYVHFNKKCTDDFENLYCRIDTLIDALQKIKEKISRRPHTKNIFVGEHDMGCGGYEVCVSYYQLENDKEFDERTNDMYSDFLKVEREKEEEKNELRYNEELRKLNEKYGK